MKKLLIIFTVLLSSCCTTSPSLSERVQEVDCRLLAPVQSKHVRDKIAECVSHSNHGLRWCSNAMKTIYCPQKKSVIFTGTNNDG